MELPNYHTVHSHLEGKCDFAIDKTNGVIYSVGTDYMINKFDIQTNKNLKSFSVNDTYYSIHISSFEPNKIILGGESNTVEIFTNENFEEGFLAMKCFGKIYKIDSDHSGKYISCVSDENTLSFYVASSKKIYKCQKSHESSCVNLCFQNPKDGSSKYVCSTACNGTLNIYEIIEKEEEVELKMVKTLKVSRETVVLNEQILQAHWNKKGDVVGLPGSPCFSYLSLENGSFNYFSVSEISHEKEISLVHWATDNVLITAGLDKYIKIWNFNTKKLLFSQKVPDFIYNLAYLSHLNTLIFIDSNGQIGFSKGFDFASQDRMELEQPLLMESKVSILENLPVSEEKKNNETNNKKVVTKEYFADNWIGAGPQNNIHSSETTLFKSRRFLCWNLIGNIIIRKDHDFNFLDIDFSDKNFHKNIRSRDIYNIEMGDMNYSGAILASKGLQENENEYEDEIHNDETKQYSYIQFKGFSYVYEACDWTIKLQKGENVECVCIGNNWCAASTDYNYIRIFNFVGIETKVLNYEKAIVAMAGYENLLAYVFNDSVPILACQNLRLKVYDIEEEKYIIDIPVAINPTFTLSWFGFSHEGLIVLQESSGIIKGLFNKSNWVTFYDNMEETTTKRKFWLIGMIDYDLIGVPLGKDELEPSTFPLPQTKIIQIELPFIKTKDWWSENKIYEKILWNKLVVQHEKFRNQNWFYLKSSRDKNNHLHKYSDSIMSQSDILNKEKEIEKMYVDFFRECLIKEEYERAINIVSSMVKYVKTIEICLVFCNKMNLPKIADKINIILKEKMLKAEFVNAKNNGQDEFIHRTENAGNLINLSNLQTNQQAPLKKNKINLSSYAIQHLKQNPITMENVKLKKKALNIDDIENFYDNENGQNEKKLENNLNNNNDDIAPQIEENKSYLQNPFSESQNEKETNNFFEMIQNNDSKKKRKLEDDHSKVQKKIKF